MENSKQQLKKSVMVMAYRMAKENGETEKANEMLKAIKSLTDEA